MSSPPTERKGRPLSSPPACGRGRGRASRRERTGPDRACRFSRRGSGPPPGLPRKRGRRSKPPAIERPEAPPPFLPSRLREGSGEGLRAREDQARPRLPLPTPRQRPPTRPPPQAGEEERAAGKRTTGSTARLNSGKPRLLPGRSAAPSLPSRPAEGPPPFLPSRLREGSGEGPPARRVFAKLPPLRQRTPTRPPPQAGEEKRAAGNRTTGSTTRLNSGKRRLPPDRSAAPSLPSRRAEGPPPFLPSRLREGSGEGRPAREGRARPRLPLPPPRQRPPTRPPPQAGEEESGGNRTTGNAARLNSGKRRLPPDRSAAPSIPSRRTGGPPLFLPSRLREGSGEGLRAREDRARPRLPPPPPRQRTPTRPPPQAGEEERTAGNRTTGSAARLNSGKHRLPSGRSTAPSLPSCRTGGPPLFFPSHPAGRPPVFLPSRLREGSGEGRPAREDRARPRLPLPPPRQRTPTRPPPQAGEEKRAAGNRTTGSAARLNSEEPRLPPGRSAAPSLPSRRAEGPPPFLPSRLREGSGEGFPARRVFAKLLPARQLAPTRPPPQAGEEERAAGNRTTGSAARLNSGKRRLPPG